MIPINKTYDPGDKVVGSLAMEENKLKFRFRKPITRDKLFDIFGNAGIRVTEWDDPDSKEPQVIAGEILMYAYMAG